MSSLSSVVSDLVRASMGSSVAPTVTDEELDKHVRELLIRDAKKRAERYGQQGIRAYLASGLSDSNAPRANKRFLSSVIRSTDEHNKTILRAQALSAEEIKRERREQEMKERRARAEEAVSAEKLRRSGSSASRRRAGDSEAWDRWDGTTSDRKRKRRNWETWTGEEDEEERHRSRRRTRHRSRSRSLNNNKESRSNRRSSRRSRSRDDRASSWSPRNSYHKSSGETHSSRRNEEKESYRRDSRSYDREDYNTKDESKPKRRRRSRSLTVQSDLGSAYAYSSSSRYHSPEPPLHTSHLREEERVKEDSATTSRHSRSPDPKPKRRKASRSSRSSQMSISRSPTPGPEQPGPALPSKMDKYFDESYDPRLDVAPLSAAPKVPATGLIDSAEFEGWDTMLDLIRIRREDKAEKKRLERMGLSKDEVRKTMFGDLNAVGTASGGSVSDRWAGEGASAMDIQYNKRGAVREWDMGKESF
ncbi:hypothetical protein GG344DRAFT_85958 [Lentinula edodes]|nr:hypothetical protein GG344DRAFT_85958 [Lentinula edodes]